MIGAANVEKLRHEHHRTVILLLAFTGMRKSSIVTLSRDTLQNGSDGHPYLRYRNIKFKREAMLPIPPPLHEQLERHETCWLRGRELNEEIGVSLDYRWGFRSPLRVG